MVDTSFDAIKKNLQAGTNIDILGSLYPYGFEPDSMAFYTSPLVSSGADKSLARVTVTNSPDTIYIYHDPLGNESEITDRNHKLPNKRFGGFRLGQTKSFMIGDQYSFTEQEMLQYDKFNIPPIPYNLLTPDDAKFLTPDIINSYSNTKLFAIAMAERMIALGVKTKVEKLIRGCLDGAVVLKKYDDDPLSPHIPTLITGAVPLANPIIPWSDTANSDVVADAEDIYSLMTNPIITGDPIVRPKTRALSKGLTVMSTRTARYLKQNRKLIDRGYRQLVNTSNIPYNLGDSSFADEWFVDSYGRVKVIDTEYYDLQGDQEYHPILSENMVYTVANGQFDEVIKVTISPCDDPRFQNINRFGFASRMRDTSGIENPDFTSDGFMCFVMKARVDIMYSGLIMRREVF